MPDINAWIEALGELYDQYGYLIVFLGALAENTALLGLALPGGTLAFLGAFYARQGTLNLGLVILFAWLGTVVGYSCDYLMGRFLLSRVVERWGASPLVRRMRLVARLRQARAFLAKHGGKAILLSHTVGHVRSFVALTAGAAHMRYRRFLAFELMAALLWNTGYSLLGYFLGAERERIQMVMERSGWVVLAVVVALYLAWRFGLPRLRERFPGLARRLGRGPRPRPGPRARAAIHP